MAEYEVSKARVHPEWTDEPSWGQGLRWSAESRSHFHSSKLRWKELWAEEDRAKDMLELVRSELAKFRSELEGLKRIQEQLGTGRAVLIEVEPLALPTFPPEEIEKCKGLILKELDAKGEAFPSDIAERYDLDMRLVLLCFNQLAKEGKIEEVG